MLISLTLRVNGASETLDAPANELLIDLLRGRLNLTGTKEACEVGECGSCTVLLDGAAVRSCLLFAFDAAGKEITTIEGLAVDGRLHPLQEAFMELGAVQCGFCIPGMILAAKALLDVQPRPTLAEIKQHLAGNLCRCTGYAKIVAAVQHAARRLAAATRPEAGAAAP
ncbi:MAG: (2Fe-2S)-binding protein [Candidatus Tectomicrobia bacterium]|nr:(2Fe-2S)-binding protein [Candidatus Tectomicrobia bacterium]